MDPRDSNLSMSRWFIVNRSNCDCWRNVSSSNALPKATVMKNGEDMSIKRLKLQTRNGLNLDTCTLQEYSNNRIFVGFGFLIIIWMPNMYIFYCLSGGVTFTRKYYVQINFNTIKQIHWLRYLYHGLAWSTCCGWICMFDDIPVIYTMYIYIHITYQSKS